MMNNKIAEKSHHRNKIEVENDLRNVINNHYIPQLKWLSTFHHFWSKLNE